MVRAALVLVVAFGACTPAQAPTARKVGKVLAIGGVTGLILGSTATYITGDQTRPLLVAFSLATTIGIFTYAAGELSVPKEADETIPQRNQRWARILTDRALGYARDGHSCYRVRHIETRVRVYDRVLHEGVFIRDPAIQKCLANPAPDDARTPAPEVPEVVQPVEPLALPGSE
jgi:hypothetical protein